MPTFGLTQPRLNTRGRGGLDQMGPVELSLCGVYRGPIRARRVVSAFAGQSTKGARLIESEARPRRRGRLSNGLCRDHEHRSQVASTVSHRDKEMRETIGDVVASGSVSHAAIAAELNRREIEALRGGRWYPMGVARLRERLGGIGCDTPSDSQSDSRTRNDSGSH